MGSYADQIAKLKLVKLLEKSGGRDEISETDVQKLHAHVLEAADIVGPLLERIPVTFKQYTEHNLSHSVNLIKFMGKFIPEKTLKQLNALEIAVLVLAAMLHDLGMFVTDEERNTFLDSGEFVQFLNAAPEKEQAIAEARAAGKHVTARVIEDAVLADYFRKFHPQRARQHIEQHLGEVLRFREYSLVDAVSRICESHGWGVYESTDPRHPDKIIAKLNPRERIYDAPFNEQYIASVLRLADIMDFDRSRTPLAVLKTIDFTEARSQAEWQKHLQIKGWEVSDRDVAFLAECTKPEHYVAVMEFIDWIDAELRDCRRLLVRLAPKDIAERYLFQLPPAVDRIHIEMADKTFVAGAFRFELDYERIMKLLMDKSLYPDPSLFLRELLQNSLDACRVRTAIAKSEGAGDKYEPRITVWDRSKEPSRTIVFQDNGVGMSRSTIENYFMRVGRSYYRSNEFQAERKRLLDKGVELEATSQFGIGFLSCFMVADKIEIETYRRGYKQLHISVEGPTKYFTIRTVEAPQQPEFLTQGATAETDGPPCFPGTRVTLHLRQEANVNVAQTLETFAVNVEIAVSVFKEQEQVEVPAHRWRNDPIQFARALTDRPNVLSTVLATMDVPLDEYEFCRGLDGRAWFWMLKQEDGTVGVRRGWLRVTESINVYGLPLAASQLGRYISRITSEESLPDVVSLDEEFHRFWNATDTATRKRILDHAAAAGPAPYWFEVENAVEALTHQSDAWLISGVDYRSAGGLSGTPAQFALHGISLPAGITMWDPMRGFAYVVELLRGSVGFAVDVRKNAPTPAANRLFVAPNDAAMVGIAVTRAFIRKAIELHDAHSAEPDWTRWFEGFLSNLLTGALLCVRDPPGIRFLLQTLCAFLHRR